METPRRHYIIVVHGIGEQKLNETTTPLIHRFAEVRNKENDPVYKNLLPAHLSAQSVHRRGLGHGWSEFEGIPVAPPDHKSPNNDKVFDGTPATDSSGKNFRFVDLHWSHILGEQQKDYASPTENWAEALHFRFTQTAPEGWTSPWQEKMLKHLVNTVVPAKKLLDWYRPEIAKRIFNDFLGDVHLYGDYARTRGRAVRHFHVILDEIHLRDLINWGKHRRGFGDYHPPVYTVIGHSLGSIMSFDALVYAHAKEKIRETKGPGIDHPCPSIPFLGYTDMAEGEENTWRALIEELRNLEGHHRVKREYLEAWDDKKRVTIPPLQWRDHVSNLVTLGSPIDKYHVLWWQNYVHMGLGLDFNKAWSDEWLVEDKRTGKILHYNLCDEQDPVGHHLDVSQGTRNYEKIFDINTSKDVVFRRYAVPGLAHVKYWEDTELFKRVIGEVIDKKSGPDLDIENREFRELTGVYQKALTWAYFRIPFIATVITGGLLSYGAWGILPCLEGREQLCDWSVDRIAAILAAVLLWACPNPKKAYEKESHPEEQHAVCWWERIKPRRSILAHLVGGAVEWRRVLIELSKRKASTNNGELPTSGGFLSHAWIRYLGGAIVLALSVFILIQGGEGVVKRVGEIGIIISAVYLSVMVYVGVVFVKAKKINQSK